MSPTREEHLPPVEGPSLERLRAIVRTLTDALPRCWKCENPASFDCTVTETDAARVYLACSRHLEGVHKPNVVATAAASLVVELYGGPVTRSVMALARARRPTLPAAGAVALAWRSFALAAVESVIDHVEALSLKPLMSFTDEEREKLTKALVELFDRDAEHTAFSFELAIDEMFDDLQSRGGFDFFDKINRESGRGEVEEIKKSIKIRWVEIVAEAIRR